MQSDSRTLLSITEMLIIAISLACPVLQVSFLSHFKVKSKRFMNKSANEQGH